MWSAILPTSRAMPRRTLRSAILLNAATNRAPSGDSMKSTMALAVEPWKLLKDG
jgi:hypothetical protein